MAPAGTGTRVWMSLMSVTLMPESVVGTTSGAGVTLRVKLDPWATVVGAEPVAVTSCWVHPPRIGVPKVK